MFVRIPLMVSGLVMTALSGFDGMVFAGLERCPSCGGNVRLHDYREKQFVNCLDNQSVRTIRVRVGRYYCVSCGTLIYADEPFYPGARFGSPVVDLARTLSARYPLYRTARLLEQMGISIDRGTVRNFSRRTGPLIPVMYLYEVPIPISIIRLSELFAMAREGHPIVRTELLRACGFPSARGTGTDLSAPA